MRCGTGVPLDQLGKDARHEVERFTAYLQAIAHLPGPNEPYSAEQHAELLRLYAEHYPEHVAREVQG